MENLSIDQAKELLNQGFGSIYTKEEVLSLLDRIQAETKEIDFNQLFISIRNHISNQDSLVDLDSCEFEVIGSNELQLGSYTLDDYYVDNLAETIIETIKTYNNED